MDVLVARDVSECLAIPSTTGNVQVWGIMSNTSCFLHGQRLEQVFRDALILFYIKSGSNDKNWLEGTGTN